MAFSLRAAGGGLRLILAGVCLLAPSVARAQLTINNPGHQESFPGTVRESLVSEINKTNTRIFGVMGVLDRVLFPELAGDKEEVLLVESNQIYNVVKVPGVCYPVCSDRTNGFIGIDAFSSSLALGVQSGGTGLFYAASWTGMSAPDTALLRPMAALAYSGIGYFQGLTAPLRVGPTKIGPSFADVAEGSTEAYVIGGKTTLYGTMLYAGFLATSTGNGMVTNITQEKLRLLASAAISDNFSDIPFLKMGLDRVPDIVSYIQGNGFKSDEKKKDGTDGEEKKEKRPNASKTPMTSLYARKINLVPPQSGPDGEGDDRKVKWWTIHAEQMNIGGFFDIKASLAVAPKVQIHEFLASVHSEGFNLVPGEDADDELSFGASAGLVQLPPLYYFGVQGGAKISVAADVRYGKQFRMSLRRNEPDVLSLFPYAYDSWNFYIQYDISSLFSN